MRVLCAAGLDSTQRLEQVLADVGDPPSSLEDKSVIRRPFLFCMHSFCTACCCITAPPSADPETDQCMCVSSAADAACLLTGCPWTVLSLQSWNLGGWLSSLRKLKVKVPYYCPILPLYFCKPASYGSKSAASRSNGPA